MKLKSLFAQEGLRIVEKEPLARHTTLRVGGVADFFFAPENYFELLRGVTLAEEMGLPLTFLGGGSNLLVRDGGVRGLVVSLRAMRSFSREGDLLEAEAGAFVPEILSFCATCGLSGLEFLAGVPATIGGAVVMNAGAFGQEMKDVLTEVTVLENGAFRTFKVEELPFSYRSWGGPEKALVVKAKLRLFSSSPEEVRGKMSRFLAQRKHKQPLRQQTAGCVFKNPAEAPAGYLIEKAGLKGCVCGQAAISRKHANFIVNLGGARASEVLSLMDRAKEEVFKAFGIELSEEVRVVGEA
ncbi:MAG: UDP-N-acetylmuramate dehydrogenase [Thermodesulfobacteria bacterium]|nr:UDP-N-acetylmuramate dehydrogenase [Thermodesulfobacteriota bacterium]